MDRGGAAAHAGLHPDGGLPMTRRRRLLRNVAAGLASVILLAAAAAILIVRSQWFYEKVRQKIVATVEDATGGRVELQSYSLDWKSMLAEGHGFVLHGTEAAGEPH